MYLVMELCAGGELSKELKAQGTLREQDAKTIMHRLASAIAYLHKNGKWRVLYSSNDVNAAIAWNCIGAPE